MRFLLPLLVVFLPLQAQDLPQQIEDFAAKIVAGENESVAIFKEALQSDAGKKALAERLGKQARKGLPEDPGEILDWYIDRHFEEVDGKYRLRGGQDEFRKELIEAKKKWDADMEKIRPVLEDLADNLVDEPEINAKLAAFLKSDEGPAILYYGAVRPATQADFRKIEKEFRGIFVLDDEGRYVIPEERREDAEIALETTKMKIDIVDRVTADLKDFAKEVAESDELHKKLKEAVADPLFVSILLQKALDTDDPERLEQIESQMMDNIYMAFGDTEGGLMLLEEHRRNVQQALEMYDRSKRAVVNLRVAVKKLIAKMREGDELLDGFRKLLDSDMILVQLAGKVGGGEPDAGKAARMILQQAFEKNEDGMFAVKPDAAQNLVQGIQKLAKEFRKQTEALAAIDDFADKLEDEELAEVYRSHYGKFAVAEEVQAVIQRKTEDPLGGWIKKHFKRTEEGFVLRDGEEDEIHAILMRVDELLQEQGE
ncbi:MAG: hypothetical protein ACYTAF_09730 [Planctomycetota bacterium]|jgi:hypothetical protein